MTGTVVCVVLVATLVVFLVLPLRGPAQARWLSGTGFGHWRATASRLTRRDRRAILRANRRGWAAPARLAGPAIQRGHLALNVDERLRERVPRSWRRLQLIVTAIAAISLAWSAVVIMSGDRSWTAWVNLGCFVGLLLVLRDPVGPLLLGWSRTRTYTLLRSVKANRALLDQDR